MGKRNSAFTDRSQEQQSETARDDCGDGLTGLWDERAGQQRGRCGGSGDLAGEFHPPVHEPESLLERPLGDKHRLDAELGADPDAIRACIGTVEAVRDRLRLDRDRLTGLQALVQRA